MAASLIPIRGGSEPPTASEYHTDPPGLAQFEFGSLDSVVAPTVVPRTVCGSEPRLLASARLSFGGVPGAATAVAPAAVATTQSNTLTAHSRTRKALIRALPSLRP